jgi:hypothetical protein
VGTIIAARREIKLATQSQALPFNWQKIFSNAARG